MPSTLRLVFAGPLIHTFDHRTIQILPRALLGVADGRIAWLVKDVAPSPSGNALLEAAASKGWSLDSSVTLHQLQPGEFIVPGFIDTHTHASQAPNLGRGQDFELLDWLKNVTFPTEMKFRDAVYARRIYDNVVTRTLNSGTTTSCFFATLHEEGTNILADVCHQRGLRSFVGKVNMDCNGGPQYFESSTEASLTATRGTISHILNLSPDPPSAIVQPIITPRFAVSCSGPLLRSLGDLAKEHPNVPIQTHISENPSEVAFVRTLFPGSKSYTHVYEDHGLLRENTILAHGCHLDSQVLEPGTTEGAVPDSELELIKARGAGLSHCPTSNINLRSGIARVGEWLDRGLKVGLGTDVSGGYSMSILSAVRNASFCSKLVAMEAAAKSSTASTIAKADAPLANRQLPIETLLFLATLGGAQVCNMQHAIGNFEEGKRFDALLVSTRDECGNPNMWIEPDELDALACEKPERVLAEQLEKFLLCGDDRNIRRVFVDGRLVGGAAREQLG